MSFQTVLSIVGVAFSAFEMYKRFRPKSSSPRAEPKHSVAPTSGGEAGATADAEPGKLEKAKLGESQAPTSETPRSAVSSKIGMA